MSHNFGVFLPFLCLFRILGASRQQNHVHMNDAIETHLVTLNIQHIRINSNKNA